MAIRKKETVRTEATRSDATSRRILKAAVREFSVHGLAGARIDAIAAAAHVNKALLYYYFKSKSGLYAAALESVSEGVIQRSMAVLEMDCSAGERLLRTALNHFDRILSQQEFQSLMQQEMVRFKRGEQDAMPLLARKVFQPLFQRMSEVVQEGMTSGELCQVDWLQMLYAALGANAFYFLTAPVMQVALGFDPLNPEALRQRRRAAVEFLGQACFVDRARGARLAKRALGDTPMPEVKKMAMWRRMR